MFIPIGNYSNWENIDGPGFHYVSEINQTYTVKKKVRFQNWQTLTFLY